MKPKLLLVLAFALITISTGYATTPATTPTPSSTPFVVNEDLSALYKANVEAFLKMTPKEYEKVTGKHLNFMEVIKLKAAQKALKAEMAKGDDGMSKGVYILLAILGLSWIAMGVKDDWKGSTWIVNLLLTFLCWLPGFIHALVKMKDYYKE